MGKLFGTDGIRGIANETLDSSLAFRIGQATALVMGEERGTRPLILIGRDTRISGDMLEWFAGGGPLRLRRQRDAPRRNPHAAVAYLAAAMGRRPAR